MDNLIQQLKNLKLAIDASSIVVSTDTNGIITDVNQKFCEVSGYDREELIGKTHRIVNSQYHPPEFFTEMWETIKAKKIWTGEVRNKKKDGNFYWVKTTIIPILDLNGQIEHFFAVRHEITELKEAQKVIVDQQARLAVASKFSAIGEMAANLTHEINNPLAAILGRCEMLLTNLNEPNINNEFIQKSIENIEFTARRIERVIKSMRSFSVAGDSDPCEATSIKNLIDETVEFVEHRFRDHNIDLSVEFLFKDDEKSKQLECRSSEVSQILLNLLNNSFDAVRLNEPRWVKVSCYFIENDSLAIAVTDSGSGIAPHIASRIFDPFYSTKEKQYGTGLGLSISKGLAERHHGCLRLDTEFQGTRFILTLPLIQPKKKKVSQ